MVEVKTPKIGEFTSAASAAGVTAETAHKNPFDVASTLIGKGEVPDRAAIQDYLKNGGVNLDPATTAWCAAYVNASLAQSGYKGTGSNLARSFLHYGEAVDAPQKGDIAVFSRGSNPSLGHVGFFDSVNPDGSIRILAGNQGNAVSYGNLPADRLLGYRRPPQETSADSAAGAVNAMAGGTLDAAPEATVQNAGYVPPPFSGQQPQFAPLFAPQPQQQLQTHELTTPAPEAPVAAPAPDDLLKAWGLQDEGTAPAATENPDDALIKAWGLDKTDAAPAEGLSKADQATPANTAIGLNDAVRSVATGVPVIGGLLNKMNAGTNALIAPVINPMLSDENRLKGESFGERYANSLAQQEGMDATYAAQHPIANTVGNVAGGIAGTIPLIAAAPGLMGSSSTASLGANMLMGGLTGSTMGAADSAIRSGGDIGQTIRGAELGGAFGAGAPVAGKVIGAAANKLLSVASNMTPKGAAANSLKEALANSGQTVDDVALEMARNPRLNALDIDPNVQQMGMNLANQGGAPRSILNNAVESRMAGARGAVDDAFDTTIGSVPDVKVYLDNLKTTTAANAKKAFGDALTGAKPVDITTVLDTIDKTISPGVQAVVGKASEIPQGPVEQALVRVRSRLANDTEMLTDAERLHQIQSQLRVEADTLGKSASGQDKLVASALRKVRSKLVDQIDDATGGKFKPAQQQYADDNAIQDAFDKGREVFKNGTGDAALENRPEYWEAWKKKATPAELEAAKVGARVAVDQTIRGVRNAAQKGSALGDVDLNTARLEVLLGKTETAKLSSILKDEQRIAQTNAKLFAGSQTAPRQAANKLIRVTEPNAKFSFGPASLGAAGAAYNLYHGSPLAALGSVGAAGLAYMGKYGVQVAQRARDIARNRLIAEAIVGDVTKLRDATAAGSSIPQMARSAQMGTNRLLTTISPAAVNQITDYRAPNVPLNVPAVGRRPLEITVTPNRR